MERPYQHIDTDVEPTWNLYFSDTAALRQYVKRLQNYLMLIDKSIPFYMQKMFWWDLIDQKHLRCARSNDGHDNDYNSSSYNNMATSNCLSYNHFVNLCSRSELVHHQFTFWCWLAAYNNSLRALKCDKVCMLLVARGKLLFHSQIQYFNCFDYITTHIHKVCIECVHVSWSQTERAYASKYQIINDFCHFFVY